MTSTVTSDPKPQQEGDAVVRPKRPLSAYNLFYRFKRAQLLAAAKGGRDNSPDAVRRLLAALPGLEDIPSVDLASLTSEELGKVNEVRGNASRGALTDMLTPKDTSKRSHRKGEAIAGALSFLEMSRISESNKIFMFMSHPLPSPSNYDCCLQFYPQCPRAGRTSTTSPARSSRTW